MSQSGWCVASSSVVPDDTGKLADALGLACDTHRVVVVIGGLGPTRDDLTRAAVAAHLGVPLEASAACDRAIRAFLADRGLQVSEAAIRAQALVPRGALRLPNICGTAPGLLCRHGQGVLFLLPGPPREFVPMFRDHVLPLLPEHLGGRRHSRTLCVCGLAESAVAERVDRLLRDLCAPLSIAYCARPSGVHVRLTVDAGSAGSLASAAELMADDLGPHLLPEGLLSVQEHVAVLLAENGWTLATAESCTGGLIAAQLTDLPGSSRYFQGGIVSYADTWKQDYLGVDLETLEVHGTVSRDTAETMISGLLERTGVDAGIAVTGIAGPGGGTPEKPVGLVYIGVAFRGERHVRRFIFRGTRETVRLRAAGTALDLLRGLLLHQSDQGAPPAGVVPPDPHPNRDIPSLPEN